MNIEHHRFAKRVAVNGRSFSDDRITDPGIRVAEVDEHGGQGEDLGSLGNEVDGKVIAQWKNDIYQVLINCLSVADGIGNQVSDGHFIDQSVVIHQYFVHKSFVSRRIRIKKKQQVGTDKPGYFLTKRFFMAQSQDQRLFFFFF